MKVNKYIFIEYPSSLFDSLKSYTFQTKKSVLWYQINYPNKNVNDYYSIVQINVIMCMELKWLKEKKTLSNMKKIFFVTNF